MLQVFIFVLSLFGCLDSLHLAVNRKKHIHPEILHLVTKRGYPFEMHEVTTSDGYILTLYRIPHGKNTNCISNKPVLVQHGLFVTADQFLVPETTHGLGYVLADNGYDVWLGNWRGNQFSRNHTSLNPDKDSKFWHFSWHELGMFDLPAMIDYVLSVTNQTKLYYIGHSQGTTAFYVLATTRPEYNAKIIAQISLSPIVYMTYIQLPLARILAPLVNPISRLLAALDLNEFSSSFHFVGKFIVLCKFHQSACGDLISIIFGSNPSKLSTSMVTLLRFNPFGSSIRQTLHYLQEINSKSFHWYDHGENNMEVYGSVKPLEYNLSFVTTPTYMFYSRGDTLVGERDVFRLCKELKSVCLERFLVPDVKFTHIDFSVGERAPELVFNKILEVMQQH